MAEEIKRRLYVGKYLLPLRSNYFGSVSVLPEYRIDQNRRN